MMSGFISHLKTAALPTVAIIAVLVKIGMVGAGPSTPDMLKPAPAAK